MGHNTHKLFGEVDILGLIIKAHASNNGNVKALSSQNMNTVLCMTSENVEEMNEDCCSIKALLDIPVFMSIVHTSTLESNFETVVGVCDCSKTR